MSGATETPHEWDESTRVCKRCRCTSTDWQLGNATTCKPPTNLDGVPLDGTCPGCGEPFSYYGNASAQVPRCNSCRTTVSNAADDVVFIRQRMKEIEAERLVEAAPTDLDLVAF